MNGGRLTLLAIAYATYASAYLVLRTLEGHVWAGWLNLAVQALLDVATLLLGIGLARASCESDRAFLRFVAAAALFGVSSDSFYGYAINVLGINPNASHPVALTYQTSYTLFLATWSLAWLSAARSALHVRRPSAGLTVAATIGLGAFAAVFLAVYLPVLEQSELEATARTFHWLFAGAQLLAIVVGLITLIVDARSLYLLTFVGFATLVCVDFVLRGEEITSVLVPVHVLELGWTFGQALVLAGLIRLPAENEGVEIESASESNEQRSVRSRVSELLAVVAIVPMAFVVVLAQAVDSFFYQAATLTMVLVLVTVAVSVAARASGAAFSNLIARVRSGPAQDEFGPPVRPGIAVAWSAMSLEAVCDALRDRLTEVAQRVTPIGPEPIFPVQRGLTYRSSDHAFVLMPFSPEWAPAVHESIQTVLSEADVTCLRADDFFTSTDIVQDIWEGIRDARLVVADLTGRNPNVMYEVGLAHALAKPTILLCQDIRDLPFDLSTRRALLYEPSETGLEALRKALASAVREVVAPHNAEAI